MAAIPGLGGGVPQDVNITGRHGVHFRCSDEMRASAFLLTSLGVLGISANILLMATICFRRSFKRWDYWVRYLLSSFILLIQLELWTTLPPGTCRHGKVSHTYSSWYVTTHFTRARAILWESVCVKSNINKSTSRQKRKISYLACSHSLPFLCFFTSLPHLSHHLDPTFTDPPNFEAFSPSCSIIYYILCPQSVTGFNDLPRHCSTCRKTD